MFASVHSCSLVFTRVYSGLIRVNSCLLVFTRDHTCSFMFIRGFRQDMYFSVGKIIWLNIVYIIVVNTHASQAVVLICLTVLLMSLAKCEELYSEFLRWLCPLNLCL